MSLFWGAKQEGAEEACRLGNPQVMDRWSSCPRGGSEHPTGEKLWNGQEAGMRLKDGGVNKEISEEGSQMIPSLPPQFQWFSYQSLNLNS